MTRIGNVDQLLFLLREQLQRAERARTTASRIARSPAAPAGPLDRVRILAQLGGLSEQDVRRAIIRSLLAQRFGERLANDAGFQPIIGAVLRIVEDSEESRDLVSQAIEQLKTDPRTG